MQKYGEIENYGKNVFTNCLNARVFLTCRVTGFLLLPAVRHEKPPCCNRLYCMTVSGMAAGNVFI